MSLVPINSTLNRVMIKELGLSATLVVVLASLPYLFSPLQVAIGSTSDRRPFLGRRRSFYVLAGLVLCAAGVVIAPWAALLLADRFWLGLLVAGAGFGAWGMGYNLAAVSYLALATELSGEGGRSRTVSIMWIMMIVAIIGTSLGLGRLLPVYSPRGLIRAFAIVGGASLLVGLAGLAGLEPRGEAPAVPTHRASWREHLRHVSANPQARLFFIYLLILLTAILGQDLLLEPFAGEVLGMPVDETSRLASVWDAFFLAALAIAGGLGSRVDRRTVAYAGGVAALAGLLAIAASGVAATRLRVAFYPGVILLGSGAGLATIANLSLMLDMTVAGDEGLYMGVWGIANALSRFAGSTMGGLLRDALGGASAAAGYVAGFLLLALLLLASLVLLGRINVASFREEAHREGWGPQRGDA